MTPGIYAETHPPGCICKWGSPVSTPGWTLETLNPRCPVHSGTTEPAGEPS